MNVFDYFIPQHEPQHALVSFLENYEALTSMLIYSAKLPNLNELIKVLLHIKAKKKNHVQKHYKKSQLLKSFNLTR
jgi:hypothetical protein